MAHLVVNLWVILDCEQSLFCSKIREEKVAEHESRASGGRRAKRETAMVSYNDCEARHSGDGVILLVDDDTQLSAIFIGDMRGEFEPFLPTGFDINQICQTQLASRLSIQRILYANSQLHSLIVHVSSFTQTI